MKVLTADEARQLWPVLEPAITQALSRQGPPSPLFQGELFRAIFTGQAHVLIGADPQPEPDVWLRGGPGWNYPCKIPEMTECASAHCQIYRRCKHDIGIGVVYLDGDVCNLAAYNGTLREIKLLKDAFVALARAAGCRSIRITGDRAWMRVVPGLRQRCVVMELAI